MQLFSPIFLFLRRERECRWTHAHDFQFNAALRTLDDFTLLRSRDRHRTGTFRALCFHVVPPYIHMVVTEGDADPFPNPSAAVQWRGFAVWLLRVTGTLIQSYVPALPLSCLRERGQG